jgi:GDP-4-dehydro-6-deoxy-D-mannose reductase
MTAMPARVLVTGCTGFIARHLIPELRRELPQAHLIGVAHEATGAHAGLDQADVVDLRDGDALRDLIARTAPDAVVHLAARRDGTLGELLDLNAVVTDRLLTVLRESSTPARVVVAGSSAEIGSPECGDAPLAETVRCRPIDAYGIAKLAQSAVAEAAFLRFAQPVVRVRIFNLLGPGLPSSLLPGRCVAMLAERVAAPLPFRDLGTGRDYLDVRDAARALAAALVRGAAGALYHVGSGRARSGREVVEALIAASGLAVGYQETMPSPRTVPVQIADASRAARELGWTPQIPFEQSIRDMWEDRTTP